MDHPMVGSAPAPAGGRHAETSTPYPEAPHLKYILVQHGCPDVVDELPAYHPNRLAVLARTWEHVHAFDDTSRYALTIDSEPTSTIWQRLLAHTFHNPSIAVAAEWRKTGERSTADIIALVEDGLKHDDDVIQQWFDATEVLRLLKAARTWDELLMAVNCISGRHETDDQARRFVHTVLPDRT